MKNKTLRTKLNEIKKVIAAFFAISVLFAFTGCGNSSQQTIQTQKQESSSTTEMGSADRLNENGMTFTSRKSFLLITKDAWDKAFGLMNKNAAGDAMSENYADSSQAQWNLTKTLSLKKNIKLCAKRHRDNPRN